VPALFWLAPVLGGVGAALVSLMAYGTSFALLLTILCRRFDTNLSRLLLVRPADLAALRPMVREQIQRWLPAPARMATDSTRRS
jgi:hypothetical protein